MIHYFFEKKGFLDTPLWKDLRTSNSSCFCLVVVAAVVVLVVAVIVHSFLALGKTPVAA